MNNWILNLPVLWIGALILAGTYLVTAGIYLLVTKLAVGDRAVAFKSISPGMLPPIATIFALLVGFLAAQDWSQGERASAAVNREAGALRTVVLLAAAFPGEPESRLRHLVRDYIQDAVAREWPAMARQDVTLTIAPPKLTQALRLALSLTPQKDGQIAAQRELVPRTPRPVWDGAELALVVDSPAGDVPADDPSGRTSLRCRCRPWCPGRAPTAHHPEQIVDRLGEMDRVARPGWPHLDHHRDGAQRQPHRKPHHPGDLQYRCRGGGPADRFPQPSLQR